MTDRELLELAAKVAGNEVWTDVDGNLYTCMQDLLEAPWNPLTDDGDALRLAVKLHIDIDYCRKVDEVCAYVKHYLGTDLCGYHSHQVDIVMSEVLGKDPMGATRRAIVRAAAEIQFKKEKGNERTRD